MSTSATTISKPVGIGCPNTVADVRFVKQRLNVHSAKINLTPQLDVNNPTCATRTIDAIKNFQRIVVGNPQPTGRIRPDGPTIKALADTPAGGPAALGRVTGKTSGVIPGIIAYLNAVSCHYGKEIVVTSGKRSAHEQGEAMWKGWGEHLIRGRRYIYLQNNPAVRQELDNFFNNAHAPGASAAAKATAKQSFVTKVIALAGRLSRHLTGEAVDIALGTDRRILDALKVGFFYLPESYKGVLRCHHFDIRTLGRAPEITAGEKAKWPK